MNEIELQSSCLICCYLCYSCISIPIPCYCRNQVCMCVRVQAKYACTYTYKMYIIQIHEKYTLIRKLKEIHTLFGNQHLLYIYNHIQCIYNTIYISEKYYPLIFHFCLLLIFFLMISVDISSAITIPKNIVTIY